VIALLLLLGKIDVAEIEVHFDKVRARSKLRDENVGFLDLVLELPAAMGMKLDDVADVVGRLAGRPSWRCVLHAGIVKSGEGIGGFGIRRGMKLKFWGKIVDDGFGGEETVTEEKALVRPWKSGHAVGKLK
jgi:hypothetical protein